MVHELSKLLPAPRIISLEGVRAKNEALQALLDTLTRTGAIKERVEVERAIMSREVLMSTGVGYGIALPHAKIPSVQDFAIALGVSQQGVSYSSLVDDLPAKLICMIIGPSGQQDAYLRILAMVMRFLKSEKGKILSAFDLAEIHGLTRSYDTSEGGPARGQRDVAGA
ncbi:MAG: PTS sugar transporter subunit IIA [Planctomycetota bacterium]